MPRYAVGTNRAHRPASIDGTVKLRMCSDPKEEFVWAKNEEWAAIIALTDRDDDHDNIIRVILAPKI